MTEQNSQVLEQQIAELQRQLETARAQSGQDTNTPYERSEVHQAVGEQIQQQVPTYQSAPAVNAPTGANDVPSYQDPALSGQVQQLVTVAFTQGIQAAIAQAVKTGNTALIDALHDVLADQLHQQLLERQKLEPAV